MKCPFQKIIIQKKTGSYTTETKIMFGECDKYGCVAYNNNRTTPCEMINKHEK